MGSLAEWESMPWQEIKPMDQRLEFALGAQRCESLRALCREYGISARAGYKWKQRLLEEGAWRLAEKSRRPHRSPTGSSEAEVCRLVALRHRHPHWGARKLADLYRRAHGTAPSESTIKRVLERCGPTRKRRQRRASPGGQLGGHPVATACHDIWTVDFKGWWHDAQGRCEPFASMHAPSNACIWTSATKSKVPTTSNGKPRWISGAKNLTRSGRTSRWACNDRPMFIVPVRGLGKGRPSRSTTRV